MRRLPGAMFVIDPQREHIAVVEARKLEIPVIGTGDTNVDPDLLDYVIPANDDAIRAIRLLCTLVADAAIEGAQERPRARPRSPSRPSRSRKRRATRWSPRSPPAAHSASSPSPTRKSCCRPRAPRAGRRAEDETPRRRPPAPEHARRRGAQSRGRRDARDHRERPTTSRPTEQETQVSTTQQGHRMAIPASTVKELRERTGAGMMDCKRALEERR